MILKKLRKQLAEWLYPIDVLVLTRKQLALIIDGSKAFEEMNENEQKRLCANAHSLFQNPALKTVLSYLMRLQERYTTCEAGAWDSVLLGRGTVNGLSLALEEFEKLSLIHEETQKIDKYNANDLV